LHPTSTHYPYTTLFRSLRPGCLVLLEGELGSGKTTLAKGIVAGLGVSSEEEVTSPSFTLVHEYGRERKVYHVDLYRVESARDFRSEEHTSELQSLAYLV